ncbi:hypothetical protein ACJIZ3_014852 [Penstemon smallii]|uniref:Dof zinc finger protein n=1 Tax=Penstemon smallii TaxID=265156 RepID=A0ABD3RLM0_9LAMI
MIQELFGGSNANLIGGEISKPSTTPCGGSPRPSSSTTTTTTTATATVTPTATPENLRCPRCDSANTKFCYYNNYNLTQPRYFCKTCRRYWTKGGALRNVPIGGGCRKNKNSTISTSLGKSNSAGKLKTVSQEIEKSTLFNSFEQQNQPEFPQNPILWATPHNSHLLSLLRLNPNPNPNHMSVKEEGLMFGSSDLSLDPLGQVQAPSIGLSSSYYRNQGIVLGEVQNHGIQELYQRLISSSVRAPVVEDNLASASTSSSSPVAGGELGFWNSNLSWPTHDMPTTNGTAYL